MFYADAQKGNNTCSGPYRGGCQHLCLAISSIEHVCHCAIGYEVDPKNPTRCIGKEEFIFYSNHELKGIDLYVPNKTNDADLEESMVSAKKL